MKRLRLALPAASPLRSALCGLLLALTLPRNALAEPTPEALAAFNTYAASTESRLTRQHLSPQTFLANPTAASNLRPHDLLIEHLPAPSPAGALLHHWRGTAFAPGARASDLEALLKSVDTYPRHFAPQVLQARLLPARSDPPQTHFQASMRVRQKHVLTVVMDSTYDITFAHPDPSDSSAGASTSRSLQIYEIDAPGTPRERILGPREEHGFLWRLNTYWTYQERDGGLFLQLETISLSRAVPAGLGWALNPYVESVPRDSLEFTLRSVLTALGKP